MLYGRDAERAQIWALLEGARASQSGALVIRDEAGIGKRAARGRASVPPTCTWFALAGSSRGRSCRSPRTIDSHLRNVFSKLGVTSRTQLARLPLGGDVTPAEPAAVGSS